MISTVYFPSDTAPYFNLKAEDLKATLDDSNGLLWVDLENPSDQEIHFILQEIFNFHPLCIEDCKSSSYQTPKIDDFGSYLFIVAQSIPFSNQFYKVETRELNLFLGNKFLVTNHYSQNMLAIKTIWEKVTKDERLYLRGSDFLCHAILDALVDEYEPTLDAMEEEIEKLEDNIIASPKGQLLQQILDLKHSIMSLRRIVWPMRELINRLSREDFSQIDQQSKIYFRDIYDHLVRIQDVAESIRDIVSSTLDIYLNANSLRLNEVMRALTVVSTIFLPLSFVAGVYGMNFKFMPELSWQWGYPFAIGLFFLIAIGMLLFFKKREWF
jgi:magnesium transporter